MPNRNKRRQRAKDMISNLPSDVTQHILQLLPLKDAAKTSILSKCWRYRWLSCPHLMLDGSLWPSNTTSDNHSNALKYCNIISKVLLHHIGPIHKFCLYTPPWFPADADITHWLQFVSRQGVMDFNLHTKKVPSCLFTFEGFSLLTHLTLGCNFLKFPRHLTLGRNFLNLPSMFSGFPCLISLKTRGWNADHTLEILIRSCPQLETIHIGGLSTSRTLTIHAPKLRWLVVYPKINFVLEGSPDIQTLAMEPFDSYKDMLTVFRSVPGIENLVLRFYTVRDFNGAANLEISSIHFKHLRTLELMRIPLESEVDILLFVNLLRGSPKLEKLKMHVGRHQPSTILLEDFSFINLKNVEVICDSDIMVSFLPVIKFFLASCPALEVMSVDSMMMPGNEKDEKLKMAIELLQFHRASTRAKIIFKANQPRRNCR